MMVDRILEGALIAGFLAFIVILIAVAIRMAHLALTGVGVC